MKPPKQHTKLPKSPQQMLWATALALGLGLGTSPLQAQEAQAQAPKFIEKSERLTEIIAQARENPDKRDFRTFLSKTEHFDIYYLGLSAAAAAEILRYAEHYYREISTKMQLKAPRIRIFLNPFSNEQGGFSSFIPPSVQIMLFSDSNSETIAYNWQEQLEQNFAYQIARFMLLTYKGSKSKTLVGALQYIFGPDLAAANFILMPLWLYTSFGYLPYTDFGQNPNQEPNQDLSPSQAQNAVEQRALLEATFLRGILLEADTFDYYSTFIDSQRDASDRRINQALAFLMLRYIVKNYGPTGARAIVDNVHKKLGLAAAIRKVTGQSAQELFAAMRRELLEQTAPTTAATQATPATQATEATPNTRILPQGASLPRQLGKRGDLILESTPRHGKRLLLYPQANEYSQDSQDQATSHSKDFPFSPAGAINQGSPFAASDNKIVMAHRPFTSINIPIPTVTIPVSSSDLFLAKLDTTAQSQQRAKQKGHTKQKNTKRLFKSLRWRRLTKGKNLSQPTLSADGRYLVATERTAAGHTRLVLVNQQTGTLRPIAENPAYNFMAPSFAHKSTKLVFEVHGNGNIDIAILELEQILQSQQEAEAQNLNFLFRSAQWEYAPVFSRDDTSVLFVGPVSTEAATKAGTEVATSAAPATWKLALLRFQLSPDDQAIEEESDSANKFSLELSDPAGVLGGVEAADGSGFYYQTYRLEQGKTSQAKQAKPKANARPKTQFLRKYRGSFSLHYLPKSEQKPIDYPVQQGTQALMLYGKEYYRQTQKGLNLLLPENPPTESETDASLIREAQETSGALLSGAQEASSLPQQQNPASVGDDTKQILFLLPVISLWTPQYGLSKKFDGEYHSFGYQISGGSIANDPFLLNLSYLTGINQLEGQLLFNYSLGPLIFSYEFDQNLADKKSNYRGGERAEFYAQNTIQELKIGLPLPGASWLRHRLRTRLSLQLQHRFRVMGTEKYSFSDSFRWEDGRYGIAQFGFHAALQAKITPQQVKPKIVRHFSTPGISLVLRGGLWTKPLEASYTPEEIRDATAANLYYGVSWAWDVPFLFLNTQNLLKLSLDMAGSSGGFAQSNAAEYLPPILDGLRYFLDGNSSDWALAYNAAYNVALFEGQGIQSLVLQLGMGGRSYLDGQDFNSQLHASALLAWRLRLGSISTPSIAIGLRYTFYNEFSSNPWLFDLDRMSFQLTFGSGSAKTESFNKLRGL